MAGYTLTWAICSADYTVYFHPRVSGLVGFYNNFHRGLILGTNSWRIFTYSFLGLNIPTVSDAPG